MLLGMALNETLSENGAITDGRSIALRMWNRTFAGNSCLFFCIVFQMQLL